MKKKILLALITILMACITMVSLTACSGASDGGNRDNPPHTHTYSALKYDTLNHWEECSCGEKKDITQHSFTDGKCTCGYEQTQTHTHSYPETYTFDSEFHWFECECGEKKSTAQHAFTDGKCACGYEKKEEGGQTPSVPDTPTHTHAFDRTTIHDDYLKSKATCENKAVYYYACKCGEKGTKTYEFGNALGHNYGEFVSNGDGTKTAKCANGCGIDKTIDKNHNCDFKKVETVAPTCDSRGYTVYECECGNSYNGDWVSPLGHNYGDWVPNGNGTHTKTCSNDNSHKITENCKGGTATCTEKAVCGYCKVEFGELRQHTYDWEYSYDENRHWKEVTCGCDIEPNYEDHGTDGNNCMACEYPLKPTEGIIYDKSADGTCAEVIGYEGSAKKIKIADTYQGLPVKNIYNEAFKDTDITFVIIPDSVTSIGDHAFYGSNLTSIEIPNSLESIGRQAFYGCYSLTSVKIPNSVESIGRQAFYGCDRLLFNIYGNCKYLGNSDNDYFALICATSHYSSSCTIHENAKIIADEAFFDYGSLTSIVIPGSVKSIGIWAFAYCRGLTSVEYKGSINSWVEIEFADSISNPINGHAWYATDVWYTKTTKLVIDGEQVTEINLATATKINNYAFYGYDSLTSVVIGDSVESIGYGAFEKCASLTSVVIGDSVTSIGDYAFYSCDSLTSIKYRGSETQWQAITKGSNWNYNTGNYTITYNYTGE